MNLLKSSAVAVALAGFSGATANAAALLSEDFSYADGPITSVSGGNWTLHSGTDSGTTALNVTSGAAIINQNDSHGSGADANRLFSSTIDATTDNTTKIYTSYTVNFSSLPSNSGTSTAGSYFGHLKSSALNEFYSRVGANQEGAATGTFRIAVSNENWTTASTVEFPQDLNLNTTYTVVTMLDLATDQTTLWINPSSEASTSVTATDVISYAAGAINSYALRQGTSGSSPNIGEPGILAVDSLRVGTTFAEVVPEPTGLAVLGLGAIGVLSRRRRSM